MKAFKVIVVGGGVSGLMAAGQAARVGAETLLLEKMDRPGRKLSITGKGRCNLTNIAPLREFITHFGPNGKFLRNAFSKFFASDLVEFFEEIGVSTVTERGGRVFPAGSDAKEVTAALKRWAGKSGVTLQTRSRVERLAVEDDRVIGVRTGHVGSTGSPPRANDNSGNRTYEADAVIIATGGASYPATGSTGDGYDLAGSVGHRIVPIRPALVPLETGDRISPRLQGLSLRNVMVKLLVDGRKRAESFGDMIFTDTGVSGPIILTLSLKAVDALRSKSKVEICIDLKPALDDQKLDARLLRDLNAHGKRQFKAILKGLLPSKLIGVCVQLTGIGSDVPAHQITAQQRKRLRLWLKDFRLRVTGHRPFEEAIITAGGVDLSEIDPRSMASRLMKGLFFAGEVLDIDADTGGYNLQAAYSTGWVAGRAAASYALQRK